MSYVLLSFLLKFVLYLVLFTALYNVFVIVTNFKFVKFAWNYNLFFLPLFPLIGTTYLALFGKARANMLQINAVINKFFGGFPCNMWYGSTYYYCTNIAEEARVILNHPKCLNKPQVYDNIEILFRECILTVPVETWKPRRHFLRSAFKMNTIKLSYPIFYEQSCLLLEEIKTLSANDDLYKFFNKYSFMNFFLSSFGLSDASKYKTDLTGFATLIDAIQEELNKVLTNPAFPARLWKLSPFGAKFRKIENELKGLLNHTLEDYVIQLKQGSEYLENPTQTALIGLLLDKEYKKDSNTDVFEEFFFITGAATDTTGHTLVFCFLLLAMHPEIQEKAFKEVESVIGDGNIDFNNLPELKYIDAVISETLRLLPSIPVYARYCAEEIKIGSKTFPKGIGFVVNAYELHRNPKYWKDPLKFDPTRFLPENVSKIVPGSYAAFSLGPRNCIGQSWATSLLRMTVANVVRSFTLTTSHKSLSEFKLESCISMKTTNHLDCQFIPRKVNES